MKTAILRRSAAAAAVVVVVVAATLAPNFVGSAALAASPAPRQQQQQMAANNRASVPADYRLDTGDTILINVARHPDVSVSVPIIADGQFHLLRLNGPVSARGKTCGELADELAKRLSDEGKLRLYPGQVSVVVTAARVRRIYVRGNAVGGKDLDLKPGLRISELAAMIGQVPQPDRVQAYLTNPNRPAPVKVDLFAALNDPGSPQNVPILEGDTLTIDQPNKLRLFVEGEGPRGAHEVDERFGLKRALIQLGYSTSGASGALRQARIIRKTTPGDLNSGDTVIPVDLYEILTDDEKDFALQDMDTLRIPVSEDFVYVFGEAGGPRKWPLPQDRKTFLVDVMANAGATTGKAKIGDIHVFREVNGVRVAKKYDFGKFLKNADLRHNPEIVAGDLVFVPDVKRTDLIGTIWTSWGLYGIAKAIMPGLP